MNKHITPDSVYENLELAAREGIAQLTAQDDHLNGRTLLVNNRNLIHFGNCSYLGLDLHPQIKKAARSAISNFGLQLSNSRSYVSLSLFDRLEENLEKVFGFPTLITQTTTLGHFASLPTLVGTNDCIIMDQQVHQSLQMAVQYLAGQGTKVIVNRHNNLHSLETDLINVKDKFEKIWFISDGVHSILGDTLNINHLNGLLELYPQLHAYIDDAHGMSWTGINGRGYAMTHLKMCSRTIVAVSLAKGFGVYGGALIFFNEELKRKVKYAGPTQIFSGPLQPCNLAACIASSYIHLSEDVTKLQNKLRTKIESLNSLAEAAGIPMACKPETPILFVPLGSRELGIIVTKSLIKAGFLVNVSSFPSISVKRTGIRILLTNHLKKKDIEHLVFALSDILSDLSNRGLFSYEKATTLFYNP